MTNNSDWYLLQLKPNGYKLARKNLERQGFRVFIPLQNVTKRMPRGYVDRIEPLFPGYAFVELDAGRNLWKPVNSTLGVARIISLAGKPTPVPGAIVDELMSRCDDTGILRPPTDVEVGDNVELLRGPFANFVAKVEDISPDERVWLLIDMLGQSSRIAVDKAAIQRT